MERDPLENFITTNRSAFDQALPEHDLWGKIENQLPSEGKVVQLNKPRILNMLKYAAGILLIVSASVFGTTQYLKSSMEQGVSAAVMTELNELTDYYDFEVNRKLQQLSAYEVNIDVHEKLTDIDDVIEELKVELNEVPKGNEEKVINAMINNFELKILILERMLEGKEGHFNNIENNKDEVNI